MVYNPDVAQLKTRPRKTVEDYLRLPEGTLAELIEGEILMSPSPKARHQRFVSNLHFAVRQFVEARRLGLVLDSPMDVHLPSGAVVQPDLIFVATANLSIVKDWIRGAPDLLIEVLSPESIDRDRFTKRELYAASGVKEYWIVDGDASAVEVLRLAGDRYAPHGYFEAQDTITSPVLSGLLLPVRQVLDLSSVTP